MSISLIGIVFVQIFWIMNAVKINEEQFGRKVNEAMNELVSKIETDETSNIITSNICSINVDNLPENADYLPDSLINHKSKHKTQFKKIVISKDSNGCSGLQINQNCKTIKIDSKLTGDIDEFVKSSVNVTNDNSKDVCITVIKNNNKINVKTDKFRNVVEKMLVEYEFKNIPLDRRLQQINFSQLLKSVLKNNAIDLPYEYIVKGKNKIDSALVSKGYKEDSKAFIYTVNLFPNDLVAKSDYLKLYFPERSSYIYRSLSFMIIGSIVFTLIILITFIITIFAILRQKKISEIKNDFINNMTHEFKTPIATISLATDAINNPVVLEDKNQILNFNRIIKEEALRMNSQVQKVLQMSLFDKKDVEFHITTLNAHEQIEKAVERIKLQLEQKNGSISLELNANKYFIEADLVHLNGALLNILDNAVKYSKDVPIIKISTYNKENNICFAISDNGIGMEKDDAKRVFDRFYRVHTGDVHNVKGFGLGLSYVKEVVTAFKGKVTVQSEKGVGSTFTFCLPIKDNE